MFETLTILGLLALAFLFPFTTIGPLLIGLRVIAVLAAVAYLVNTAVGRWADRKRRQLG